MTDANGIEKAVALIQSLDTAQLRSVNLDPEALSLSFRFTFGPAEEDVTVELSGTAHIALSKHPEDEAGCGIVGEVKLKALEDGGAAVLTELNYALLQYDGSHVLTYPSTPLYHFHMEGDVCADVVCSSYKVRRLKFSDPT